LDRATKLSAKERLAVDLLTAQLVGFAGEAEDIERAAAQLFEIGRQCTAEATAMLEAVRTGELARFISTRRERFEHLRDDIRALPASGEDYH
jgi:hypothetical protein